MTAMISVDPGLVAFYTERGFWGSDTLTDVIRNHARSNPDGVAFIESGNRMTWAGYEQRSNRIAAALIQAGFQPGERIGVQLPAGPAVQPVVIGVEKAGMTAIGLGVRAGVTEVAHLLSRGEAVGFISEYTVRGEPTSALYDQLVRDGLVLRRHLVMPDLERNAP